MTAPAHSAVSPLESPALAAWLGRALDLAAPVVAEMRPPKGGGWSSETWLMTLRDAARPDDAGRRIVLRLAPAGPAMFPDYDLRRQIACLRALKHVPACPVPEMLAEDAAGRVIGRPLYAMAFVDGQIPADDRPDLFEAGFLMDASPQQRERFCLTLIDTLAALHSIAPPPALAAILHRGGKSATALGRELDWLRAVFAWGRGHAAQPEIERAFDWLAVNLPDDSRAALLWGDARPANVMVRDFAPAALLDWELATLGPPELDVFWLVEMNRMRARGRLPPGFLDGDATAAAYEAASGLRLRDANWHTIFAAAKVAVLMLRHLLVRVAQSGLDARHAVLTDNVATRRLRTLMGE